MIIVTTQADIKLKCAIDAVTALLLQDSINEELLLLNEESQMLRINSLGYRVMSECIIL